MKKQILLAACAVLTTLAANAQTITVADFASDDDVIISVNDQSLTANPVSLQNPAAAQAWSFQGLENNSQDTTWFLLPAGQSNANKFPNANLAMLQSKLSNVVSVSVGTLNQQGRGTIYLNKSASKIELLGASGRFFGMPAELAVVFENPQTYLEFPASLGSTYNDAYKLKVSVGIAGMFPVAGLDSVRIYRRGNVNSTIDAAGTVSLPYGNTYANSIRQKFQDTYTDSILVFTTTALPNYGLFTTGWQFLPSLAASAIGLTGNPYTKTDVLYRWFATDGKYIITQIAVDAANIPLSASYRKVTSLAAIEELTNNDNFANYPNPANEQFTITTTQPNTTKGYQVAIMDMTGKIVDNKVFTGDKLVVDVYKYAQGLYTYHIIDNSSIVKIGKFTVIK